MNLTVTLSANAGISLGLGGITLWIDALHDQKVPGFSTVGQDLQEQILYQGALGRPDLIVYTHCHPDHYSCELTKEAAARYPGAKLLLPEDVSDGLVYKQGGVELTFLKLPHEGRQFAGVLHYGILVSWQGKRILVPGDCQTASPALLDTVGDEKIDLAILNFPWLTLKKGREFVQAFLKPQKWLACHLPFAQDDINGFRESARKACQYAGNVLILDEPLQTVALAL